MSSSAQRIIRSLLLGRSLHHSPPVALWQPLPLLQCTAQNQLQQQQHYRTLEQGVPASETPSCSFAPPFVFSRASSSSPQTQAMQLANELSAPAKSLKFERGSIRLPTPLDNKMGHFLLTMLGFYSHKSQLLHGGQSLYAAIKEQCDDGALIRAFNMDPTLFFSTYTVLSLHMWLIIHRLGQRTDRDSRDFKQRFYNNFQHDVERRVHKNISVGVSKWLKQLESVFYSSGIAFDKVLTGESKETFTEVVLNHYFGGDFSKKSQAALVAKYLQRELHCLQLTEDEAIFRGNIRFSQEPFESFRAKGGTAEKQAEKR